uniref:TSEN54 tRNA splicing endonuclease subunit n=1 Tax=Mastacembelus armatus TaxID=205130 RepID=A0A7N8WQK3_9TELE
MADQKKTDPDVKFCEILSPSELFAARSRSHKIPVRGQKDFFPSDSDEQRQRLEQSLNEHWSLISEERVERLGNLVKATWIPSEEIVELQSPAGKFWQTMGFSARGKQYLLPEEALYLMECGNLQVFYKDLPLPIQDGYERFLTSNTIGLQQYQVFGHLKRLGYVVHRKHPEPHLTASPEASEVQTATTSSADEDGGRTWWMTDDLGESSQSLTSGSSCWDFSSIHFPDLGSSECHSSCLACPDPSLLPGALGVGVCDLAPWRQRINLRKVKMSPKEHKRDEDNWNINKDKEVRQCRNWAEYQQLMARRQGRRKGRPAHLWNREVTPLHDPTQPLLDKISVIKSSNLLEGASRLEGSDDWRICFNVYQPDTVADFKKSNPGKPYSRMCVCSFEGPVPDLRVIKLLAFQSGDIPVVFAVVDHGDISFYTFKDFQLPTDVYP